MEDKELLKRVTETITDPPVLFDIDIVPRNRFDAFLQRWKLRPRKRHFVLKGLTLAQLQKISAILLDVDLGQIKADDVLRLMKGDAAGRVIAIAVTPSRNTVSESLVSFFMHHLTRAELHRLLTMVLDRMDVSNFILTIASMRNLNILAMPKPASVMSVNGSGVNPQTTGV